MKMKEFRFEGDEGEKVVESDDTLYALVDGVLRFERKGRDKKQASVYPVEAE